MAGRAARRRKLLGGTDRFVEGLDQPGDHRAGYIMGIGIRPHVGYLGPPDVVARGSVIEGERDPEGVGNLVRRLGGAADEFVLAGVDGDMHLGVVLRPGPETAVGSPRRVGRDGKYQAGVFAVLESLVG